MERGGCPQIVPGAGEGGKKGGGGLLGSLSSALGFGGGGAAGGAKKRRARVRHIDGTGVEDTRETIHVFSLATGHLYERFVRIMMLSVTKRTKAKVKFWLLENFVSPQFKKFIPVLAKELGCDVGLVTYKWPQWLRRQTEKQRIIWGYVRRVKFTLTPDT